jgi:hypothetical protein
MNPAGVAARGSAGVWDQRRQEMAEATDKYNLGIQQMEGERADVVGKADELWDFFMKDVTGGSGGGYDQFLQTKATAAVTDPLKQGVGIADQGAERAEDWLNKIVKDYGGLLPEAKRQALEGVLSTQIDEGRIGRAEGTVAANFASQRDAYRRQLAGMGMSPSQLAGAERRAGLTQAAEQAAARERAVGAETQRIEEAKKFNYGAIADLAGIGEQARTAAMGRVQAAGNTAIDARKALSAGTQDTLSAQQQVGENKSRLALSGAQYLTGVAGEAAKGVAQFAEANKPGGPVGPGQFKTGTGIFSSTSPYLSS